MVKVSIQKPNHSAEVNQKGLQPAEVSVKRKEKLKSTNITKGALKKLDRQLTEKELGNSGVSKLLLDRIDILEDDIKFLKPYVNQFHKLDTDCAVLKKELKNQKKFKLLNESCLAIGGALLGLTFAIPNVIVRIIIVFFGLFFLIFGFILSYLIDKDE